MPRDAMIRVRRGPVWRDPVWCDPVWRDPVRRDPVRPESAGPAPGVYPHHTFSIESLIIAHHYSFQREE